MEYRLFVLRAHNRAVTRIRKHDFLFLDQVHLHRNTHAIMGLSVLRGVSTHWPSACFVLHLGRPWLALGFSSWDDIPTTTEEKGMTTK